MVINFLLGFSKVKHIKSGDFFSSFVVVIKIVGQMKSIFGEEKKCLFDGFPNKSVKCVSVFDLQPSIPKPQSVYRKLIFLSAKLIISCKRACIYVRLYAFWRMPIISGVKSNMRIKPEQSKLFDVVWCVIQLGLYAKVTTENEKILIGFSVLPIETFCCFFSLFRIFSLTFHACKVIHAWD